jgi:hypothetical protein
MSLRTKSLNTKENANIMAQFLGKAWQYTPVIPALERLEASLSPNTYQRS